MQRTKPDRPIRYRLNASNPAGHLLGVEIVVPPPHPDPLRFSMPAWTPGSYKVRDFARHVQQFDATGPSGKHLRWEKTDKQTWEVQAPEGGEVTVRYVVYANELGVRVSQLDDQHAHLNGASIYLAVDGLTDRACEVEIQRPHGWKAAAAMPSLPRGRFLAADFDTLIDSPIELGSFDEAHFKERGVLHRVILCGRSAVRAVDLVPDIQKVVRAGAALFGGLPYKDYVFFIHLAAKRGGGLEHRGGCSLVVPRDTFAPRKRYLELLQLIAHEHFHVWNVKRLRPEALGPFDYGRENYTRMLWVAEGWTCYYEKMLLVRAGLMSPQEALADFAEKIRQLRETPGRKVQSLSQASFDAWIKLYQPDEHTPNSTVSYYDKGQLVAFLLDLEIRRRTNGRGSLDDVLRTLWKRYGKSARGYPDEAVREAAEEAAQSSLRHFFTDYVDGTEELDFDAPLADFGLQIIESDDGDEQPGAALGVRLRPGGDRVVLSTVLTGGAAAKAALGAGDEIIAWDSVRVDRKGLDRRLAAHRPGDRVEITAFREDLLRSFWVVLGRRGPRKLVLERIPGAGRPAGALFRGLLSEPTKPRRGKAAAPTAKNKAARPRKRPAS